MNSRIQKIAVSLTISLALVTAPALAAPVQVACIDTGTSAWGDLLNHEKILPGQSYVQGQTGTEDHVGHGTRISSLILGTTDGMILSPCQETSLVPLVYYTKLASGSIQNGGVEALCQAIYDAVDVYQCRIINISSGVPGESPALEEAAAYAESKNVLVVAAAGNDGRSLHAPASCPTVVAVGSHDQAGTPSVFSSRGDGLTLLAPGEALKVLSIRNGTEYEEISGTSYAAALVTAEAAALLEQYPALTAAELRFLLKKSCCDIGAPGWDAASGYGLLDPVLLAEYAAALHRGELLCYLDVQPEDRSYPAIKAMTELGILQGTEEHIFAPENPITRGGFVTMLYRLAGCPPVEVPIAFADVTPNVWYEDAIVWAVSKGLICGYGQDRIGPDDFITREQLAVILQNCHKLWSFPAEAAVDLSVYSDEASVSSWAVDAVRWAVAQKPLPQQQEGLLSPSGSVRRAEAAAVLEWLHRRLS